MSLLNYSTTLVAGANENVNDVQTMFNEVRSIVNDLDDQNIAPDAAIQYSKLNLAGAIQPADLNAGADFNLSPADVALPASNILVGNASGKAAAVNPAGAVEIAQSGATSIATDSGYESGSSIGVSGSNSIADTTLSSGSWLTFMSAMVRQSTSGLMTGDIELRKNSTAYANSGWTFVPTTAQGADVPVAAIGVTSSGGGDSFTARFVNGGVQTITIYFCRQIFVRIA